VTPGVQLLITAKRPASAVSGGGLTGTTIFLDTFADGTDVDITSRSPDTGSNWAADVTTASASFHTSGGGRAYANTAGNMLLGATPDDADYTGEFGVIFRASSPTVNIGMIMRANTGSGTTLQGYACRWTPVTGTTGNWVVGSYATGTFTLRDGGSDGSDTVSTGTSPTYAAVCVMDHDGSNHPRITLTVDGVQQAQWSDTSDTYTAKGRVLARISSVGTTSTGTHFADVRLKD
jgi:hypothetical protein